MVVHHKIAPHFEFKSRELERIRPLCDRILQQFDKLPALRLLCYFDDEIPDWMLRVHGEFQIAHTPIIGGGTWPPYVKKYFFDLHGERAYDNLIYVPTSNYLHGEVSFVIILAHALQHFVQWGFSRKIYKANSILFNKLRLFEPTTNAKPWDIPFNREAMIVAKKVAIAVCGEKAVAEFVEAQIADGRNSKNTSKEQQWLCFREITISTSYDSCKETDRLVQKYKQQLLALKSGIDFSKPKWWI